MLFTESFHIFFFFIKFSYLSSYAFSVYASMSQMSSAQQQKFRSMPHDLQVLERSEALLQCEVSNIAGQVQWTKDGFALGTFELNLAYIRLYI